MACRHYCSELNPDCVFEVHNMDITTKENRTKFKARRHRSAPPPQLSSRITHRAEKRAGKRRQSESENKTDFERGIGV